MKMIDGKVNGEIVAIAPEAATLRKLIRDVHSALKPIVIRTLRSTQLPESWQGPAELISVTSTCPTYEVDKMRSAGDCFSFSIPYSNTSLKVDVLLCARSLNQLPDIISEDERFFEGDRGSFVNIQKYLPALCDWTPTNSESLASILEQLVIWYQKIQVSFLPSTTRMEMEYETLVDTLDISRDAVQVFCARKIDEDSCISVRLDVDVPLVMLCEDVNTRFYVLFEFLSFDKLGDVTIKMPAFISTLFDQHLKDLIPSYEPTTLCVDIFFSVKEGLQKKLDGIAAELQRNREIFCTVTASSEVLQTDKPLFQSIKFSYLYESHQHYVVKLQLPLGKHIAHVSYQVFSLSKGKIMTHAENGSLSNTQISDRDAHFVSFNISENMKASEIWGKVVSILDTHKV